MDCLVLRFLRVRCQRVRWLAPPKIDTRRIEPRIFGLACASVIGVFGPTWRDAFGTKARVREALQIHYVRQRAFYARTLRQGIDVARMWHNSRAHHQNP